MANHNHRVRQEDVFTDPKPWYKSYILANNHAQVIISIIVANTIFSSIPLENKVICSKVYQYSVTVTH